MTTKAVDIAKVSAKGSFNYLWGLVISTVISSVGTIFIGNILGSDLYGLYSVALVVPNLITLFRDWGVNSAIVRYTAQCRAEGRISEIKSVFMSGLIFEMSAGLLLTLFSFVLSDYLANAIFNRPITSLIQIASLTIFANGLINTATAAFTGFEEMRSNSVMLICQSVIKTFLIIGLVLLGFGPLGAVSGYTVATLIAGGIGILLMASIYKKLSNISVPLEFKNNIKILLNYGIPIHITAIISGVLPQFFVFLLPIFYATDNTMIGNYQIATTFIVLIGFFTTPISTMLFPAFSKLDYKKEKETLKSVYQASVKYSALIVVPVAFAVMSLAGPGVDVLFDDYPYTAQYLALLSVPYLFTAFGNFCNSQLLNGQGFQVENLKRTAITAIIGFPLGYFMIMQFGVIGLIVTSITMGIPSLIYVLRFIKNKFDVTIDWLSSTKILVSSAIPAVLTYIVVSNLNFSFLSSSIRFTSLLELIVGAIVFLLVWIASTLFLGVISKSDLVVLRSMFSGLGLVGKILNQILDLAKILVTKMPHL